MTDPLKRQIGGSHYKNLEYQPIEFFLDMKLNFIQCNIIKYIVRHRSKNGVEDVKKARHYAEIGGSMGVIYDNVYDICDSMMIDRFVNQLYYNEEQRLVRLSISQKYDVIISICDELINSYE